MNTSYRHVQRTLGFVALAALAAGCARERRPASPVGGTPTFESELPAEPAQPPDAMGQAPGTREGAGGVAPSRPRADVPTERAPSEEHGGPSGALDERRLCDALSSSASLSVDNIPGGVQIGVTPRSDAEAANVRLLARHVEHHLAALGQPGQQPPSDASSRCLLFDMVRMGASARVSEGPEGLRILFTSDDTAGVPIVRQQARAFVQSVEEGKVR
jgi:hypothetical protein